MGERFPGNAALTITVQMIKGAHIVQPVGQFDEHHTDIFSHRQ